MADTKSTGLTELAILDGADVLPIVDDPAGTPVTKKVTVANLLGTQHDHAATDITSGQVILEQGGTEADLSATGPGLVQQATAGAAMSLIKCNFAAAVAPAVTDDSASGYSVGSRWFDTTADKEYVCLDASVGAAVWTETTLMAAGTYLPLAGGTMSGELVMADNLVTRPVLKDYGETVNILGSIGGGTQDIDLELGNVVTGTVDTNETTFTFSNPPATGTAGRFTFIVTNGGSQTVNWPASVDWAGGTAPALTVAGVDVLEFMTVDGGSVWFGFAKGLAMS